MGNNEFNLIFLGLLDGAANEGETKGHKKMKLIFQKNDRQWMRGNDNGENTGRRTTSLFFCVPPALTKPSIMLRRLSLRTFFLWRTQREISAVLSDQIRFLLHSFSLCFIGPDVVSWSEKLRIIIFHLINLDLRTPNRP